MGVGRLSRRMHLLNLPTPTLTLPLSGEGI